MQVQAQPQHQWLSQLVGEWTFESQCVSGPDKPAEKFVGKEKVKALGEVWVVCEGEGEMPGGGTGRMMMTLGFDPRSGRFVGTWVGSMMTHLWVYDGELDEARQVLTLSAEGPDCTQEGKTARYRDVIELGKDGARFLRSYMQDAQGEWQHFMTATYRRV